VITEEERPRLKEVRIKNSTSWCYNILAILALCRRVLMEMEYKFIEVD
jgi:hypothetical protein